MDTTTTTTASGLKTLTPFSPSLLYLLSACAPQKFLSFVPSARPISTAALASLCPPLVSLPSALCVSAADGIGSRGECFLADGVGEAVKEEQVSQRKILQVVLVSPQIPGNTGCIARTCAASAVGLHLVGPLGFKIDDAKLKRAGLDYWPYVVVKVHSSWAEFQDYFRQQEGEKRLLAFTKRGTKFHSDFSYRRGDFLIFGSETSGLPPEALEDCKSETIGGGTIRIPMVETYVRCLNLSVSVGIALYEAARQLNYEQLDFPNENCIDSEKSFVTEDIFA
ncbi:putative tRNA (cytidine(34)-2'-O)-methyltransferase [Pyrus x bretschneideri]|uniref:putative tRNA (cytidine(34)-2'-O)-methyltransferase n=1 Tax=Pyrus x bretschneideri TaxID=225117 RepID=UPI00202FF722|nr:putative tRNA (cytidine(34)-2'-O)-methyltransferase [Pyrus x bretschneideri]